MPSIALDDLVRSGDIEALQEWLAATGTLDIAEELSRLDPTDTAIAFRLLPRDRALAVFEALDPTDQTQVLDGLREDRVFHLLEEMDPDDRARLLDELPAKVATRLLARISPEERAHTARLLGYPEDSAGRMMTPEYVSLRASMSVADAMAKIRREGVDAETVYTLPVLDDQRHLIGVTSLRTLVLAQPATSIGDLMTTEVHMVSTDADRETAARLIQEADLIALPVVDSEGRLVGVITVDDAMEIIEAEVTEDMAFHGGSNPVRGPYLSVNALTLARARASWLLILIVAATLTVNVLNYFEDTLDQVLALALFVPLLIGTGGNSGAQASTAVIRAMAVDEVRFGDLPRIVWREARVGLLLGAMLAAAVFVPVAVLYQADLATVVALTLVTICAFATTIGAGLPLLARRVGFDPAVLSAPVITTLVDASGLVIYFLIARAVLDL